MVDILNPEYFISALFGNIYLFFALAFVMAMYLGAKNKWNLQITMFSICAVFFGLTIVISGFSKWTPLIVFALGMVLPLILWRFLRNV